MRIATSVERKKKIMTKYYIIIGSISYIIFLIIAAQYAALERLQKKTFEMGLTNACINIILKPLNVFKAKPSDVMLPVLVSIMLACVFFIIAIEAKAKQHDEVIYEAHMMTLDELKDYNLKKVDPIGKPDIDGPRNMILSKEIRLSMDNRATRRNCNVLVIGGSGAGKSRFFASPNILQYNCNFVITDPSGEMIRDYGKALEDNGYEVLAFNLTDVYRSNRYNPFHYIKEEKDVFILVNTLIKNTTPPDNHGNDPFWENSEKLLLNALILYLWHRYPEEQQTFNNVMKLVNMAKVDENNPDAKSPLDELFEDLAKDDPHNLAVQQYATFKQGAGKTLKSILISVGVRLETFLLDDVRYLTSKDEFDFDHFADTKKALFVIIPTADTTFNFLVSLLYSQLFSSLYTYVETRAEFGWQADTDVLHIQKVEQAKDKKDSARAEKVIKDLVKEVHTAGVRIRYDEQKKLYKIYTKKTNQCLGWRGEKKEAIKYAKDIMANIKAEKTYPHCPNHVRLILDEFANIGQIPDFDQKLSTIRKYDISCSIILQAISQLQEMYDKKWNTIAGNCDEKLFLGCDDSETIKWVVELLGKRDAKVENTSWQAMGQGSTSINNSSVELMTVDQVTMMAEDECLVRIRGVRPYYGKKFELTEHKNYAYAHAHSGEFEIPLSPEAVNRKSGPLSKRLAAKAAAEKNDTSKISTTKDDPLNASDKNKGKSSTPALPDNTGFPNKKPESPAAHAPRNNPATQTPSGYPEFESSSKSRLAKLKKPVQMNDDEKKMLKAGNKMRKDAAIRAKDNYRKLENDNHNTSKEEDKKKILDAFGVKPGDSEGKIKEMVESMIALETPPEESITYKFT